MNSPDGGTRKHPFSNDDVEGHHAASNDAYDPGRSSRFRLKSRSSGKRKREQKGGSSPPSHRHHHRHRHSKRHRSSRYEEERTSPPLSPNTAFRESLFDALADDEGAAYWEGVYGQPIHIYPRPEQEDTRGELERMTDEEYAAYVRKNMWERTHQATLEERERRRQVREAERAADRARRRRNAYSTPEFNSTDFHDLIDEALRRGDQRKTEKKNMDMWADTWKKYLESWVKLDASAKEAAASHDAESGSNSTSSLQLRNLIVWPVLSGKRKDVTLKAVEEFFRNAPFGLKARPLEVSIHQEAIFGTYNYPDLSTALKLERVRWHPDKIKYRYGVLGMEDKVEKSVTEVFQILDRIWIEEREKSQ